MTFTVRSGRREKLGAAARGWLLFLFIGSLTVLLAFPLYAAKGGNGKGGPKGGNDGDGGGASQAIPEQHLLWSFKLSGPYSAVRPVVGKDGTIYVVDVLDNLFAIAPDGALLWTRANAGGKGVDIGPDGTIYTGNEDWIKAYTPTGYLKWTFPQNPRAFVTQDIAVGPDGNIYVLASSGMGVFSLDTSFVIGPHVEWLAKEALRTLRNFDPAGIRLGRSISTPMAIPGPFGSARVNPFSRSVVTTSSRRSVLSTAHGTSETLLTGLTQRSTGCSSIRRLRRRGSRRWGRAVCIIRFKPAAPFMPSIPTDSRSGAGPSTTSTSAVPTSTPTSPRSSSVREAVCCRWG